MRKLKKSVSILLSAAIATGVFAIVPISASAESAAPELKNGTYVPNQAVVLFRESALDD